METFGSLFYSIILTPLSFVVSFVTLVASPDVIFFFVLLATLTLIGNFLFFRKRLNWKKILIIYLVISVILTIVISIWESSSEPEIISDEGNPCIHSLMCEGRCWSYDSNVYRKDAAKKGVFTIGECGYSRHPWGCNSEISWGIASLSLCVDPAF